MPAPHSSTHDESQQSLGPTHYLGVEMVRLNLGDDQWEWIEHQLLDKASAFSVNVNKSWP